MPSRSSAGECFAGLGLHRPEAALELGVGAAQRGFGVDALLACPIDHREQQVADLLLALLVRDRGFDFGQFLVDLGAGAARVGPVEAGARGAFLELLGAKQGGEAERDAFEGAYGLRALTPLRPPLRGLDLFPQMMAALGCAEEDVRVAALHLVADRSDHVREREMAGFLGHAAVEDDLEQQIAEFVLEIGHVAALTSVGDFIGFLDRIGRDRLEGLDGVPFATGLRIAQPRHDRDEPFDIIGGGHATGPLLGYYVRTIIYIMLN